MQGSLSVMRSTIVVIICVVVCATLTGCGQKDHTIKVGVAGPMTGPDAKMGSDFRNGATIALEEWNNVGGLFGKKIEIVFEDDGSDPKQAVAVANRLVNEG